MTYDMVLARVDGRETEGRFPTCPRDHMHARWFASRVVAARDTSRILCCYYSLL